MISTKKFSLTLTRYVATSALAALVVAPANAQVEPTAYRDLNHNGLMDPYENSRLDHNKRVDDLLKRMTVEEKVGTMMHGGLPVDRSGKAYDLQASDHRINTSMVTSFITRLTIPPKELAAQHNAVQRIAERGRLGIPLTISSDPRNHFQAVLGASTTGGGFSQWPEFLGFAAIGDPALVRRFGDIARGEYRAVGIHMALSPQADLATEPRWPRSTGTFGADPRLVSRLAGAYIAGFQGSENGLTKGGVATVAKHWVGYGAQPEGFDGHNYYGRVARLDNKSFAQHVRAFDGVFASRSAGIMPAYPIIAGVTIDGRQLESVAAGFSHQLLTDLLRRKRGFKGFILSDWGVTNDCPIQCSAPTAELPQTQSTLGTPWGVEAMSKVDRFAKGVNAGIDQFGGTTDTAFLLDAIKSGKVPMHRVDDAVRRVLLVKYQLGLFDNPFVDESAAERIVGNAENHAAAEEAQKRAQIILENRLGGAPLTGSPKVWLYNIDAEVVRRRGLTVVTNLAEADVAILRVSTPSELLHPYHIFGARQNEGRLDFRDGDPDYEAIKKASAAVPTVVAVDLDRPAILTNVRDKTSVLLGTFGASDGAVLDVLMGRGKAEGRLPFNLPRSMQAVGNQAPALPDDDENPLYLRGYKGG